MLIPRSIADLIPHAGAMVLLDEVLSWDDAAILCRTRTHLDPANPLRRAGRLSTVCALEYALQAAALHGALRDRTPQPRGFVARLRDVALHAPRLDDPDHGALLVAATLDRAEPGGTVYTLQVTSQCGAVLAAAVAAIALPLPSGEGRGEGPTSPRTRDAAHPAAKPPESEAPKPLTQPSLDGRGLCRP